MNLLIAIISTVVYCLMAGGTSGVISSRKHIPGAPPFSPELSGISPSFGGQQQQQQQSRLSTSSRSPSQDQSGSYSDSDVVDEQARKQMARQRDAAAATAAEVGKSYSRVQMKGWPIGANRFGQITAVATDKAGRVVIFHRGAHKWDALSFDMNDNYRKQSEGPIAIPTVLTIDPVLGEIVQHWGENRFYLPHGLSFDSNGSLWVTDVALHQAFKFPAGVLQSSQQDGLDVKPLISLGTRFEAGSDQTHFCKPTSVAVDSTTGDIYVADGYCNSRVVRFDPRGNYISQFGHEDKRFISSFSTYIDHSALSIPHKIVLVEEDHLACVADREHGRVVCFSYPDGSLSQVELVDERLDGRLFSVAYYPPERVFYAVAGSHIQPTDKNPIMAFAFNATTQETISTIAPISGSFSQPHDIAVSPDGKCLYVVEIGPNNLWRFCKPGYTDGQSSGSSDQNPLTAPLETTSITRSPQQAIQSSTSADSSRQSVVSRRLNQTAINVVQSLTHLPGLWRDSSNKPLLLAVMIVPIFAFVILLFVLNCRISSLLCCFSSLPSGRGGGGGQGTHSGSLLGGKRRRTPIRRGGKPSSSSSSMVHDGDGTSPIKGWLRKTRNGFHEKYDLTRLKRHDPQRDGFRLLSSDEHDYLARGHEDDDGDEERNIGGGLMDHLGGDSGGDSESDVEQFNANSIKTKTDRC